MKFNRQTKTLTYLLLATIIGWASTYFMDRLSPSGLIMFVAPPLLFGTALIFSNWNYLKGQYSLAIPIIFLIIYCYGTIPFYDLGRELFNDIFASKVLGCASAFLLVTIAIKLTVKDVRIGLLQVIMILFFPVVCILLEVFFRRKLGLDLHNDLFNRLDLTGLIYQFFLSIYVTSMLPVDL